MDSRCVLLPAPLLPGGGGARQVLNPAYRSVTHILYMIESVRPTEALSVDGEAPDTGRSGALGTRAVRPKSDLLFATCLVLSPGTTMLSKVHQPRRSETLSGVFVSYRRAAVFSPVADVRTGIPQRAWHSHASMRVRNTVKIGVTGNRVARAEQKMQGDVHNGLQLQLVMLGQTRRSSRRFVCPVTNSPVPTPRCIIGLLQPSRYRSFFDIKLTTRARHSIIP